MQVHACYEALFLAASQKKSGKLDRVAALLQDKPWVLLQSPLRHVHARQLCFGAEEDQFEGYFPVPKELLALVQKYPEQGKELMVRMGSIDLNACSLLPAGSRSKPGQEHGM